MSNARFFSAIALTAVVTGTLAAGLTFSRPAHAEGAVAPVCKTFAVGGSTWTDVAAWMAEQEASGHKQFVSVGPAIAMCAW